MDRRRLLLGGAALAVAVPVLGAFPGTRRSAAAAEPPSGRLPSRAEITDVLRRVADHWISSNGAGDNAWARATFYSGLMALYTLTEDDRYLDYARTWAEQHSYGISGGTSTRNADNHTAIQVYLDLYEAEPDEQKLTAAEATLRHMLTDQPDKNDDWWWDDALHMGMPPFARFGRLREDTAFWDKLHKLYDHTKNAQGGPGLYDTGTGLWYRDDNFLPGGIESPNGKPVLWARGNGWVAGGHVKTLKALPEDADHAAEYRDTLVRLVTALGPLQREDGFWNVNLADPDHFPGPETSGTSFFTYGTAYAVGAGLVDRDTWLPVAARAWNGLVATAVHSDGFLGYVQGVGDRPDSSQPVTYDSTADFGVGGFLLAGAELAGLAS
ncbi:glycoside hydrolase family 88 protein [Streptomyces sp. TS71-3]|uniref:glycoside hydrolase family 88 protein n=1 Tax=Streptomyces sp. TS71-3 TaxID=2733862 RepID=UPI001B0965C6|nr:glycoside hydrolase family 88 protein [Streptomyces sp. TS71-3]GHJ39362.1 glycosyl hydrolase family 88 [Streptomyces sp. TS71-3]